MPTTIVPATTISNELASPLALSFAEASGDLF
jgi:hypothetical protein